MVSKTFGGSVYGVDATIITVEVHVGQGQKFFLAGLPDSAIKESEHRVESSIKNNGFAFPRQKVVVNLAPADLRKEGSAYDLPIALAVLKSSDQIFTEILDQYMIMGELSLEGVLRPIKGVLPIAIEAKRNKLKGFILPKENAAEAAIVSGLDIIGVENILEAIDFLEGKSKIEPLVKDTREIFYDDLNNSSVDFSDVQGQDSIKRALEVAAAE